MTISKSFGTERSKKEHILRGSDLGGEIADLRKDVGKGFENSEGREGFPEFDFMRGAPTAAGTTDIVLRGRNLLQGQTFDTLALVEGASSVTVFPAKPGDSGITAQVVAGAGALAVTYNSSTKKLVITLASGGSTAAAIATAINANAAQTDGYVRANSAGGGSLTLDIAETALAGGVGNYAENLVHISGVEALPANTPGATSTANWADTVITVTVPVLTAAAVPRAAADVVGTKIKSNGVFTCQISSVLT